MKSPILRIARFCLPILVLSGPIAHHSSILLSHYCTPAILYNISKVQHSVLAGQDRNHGMLCDFKIACAQARLYLPVTHQQRTVPFSDSIENAPQSITTSVPRLCSIMECMAGIITSWVVLALVLPVSCESDRVAKWSMLLPHASQDCESYLAARVFDL